MALTLVNNGTFTAANLSTLAVAMPSGTLTGNALVTLIGAKDNTGTAVDTESAPSGWTVGATAQTGTVLSTADLGSTRSSCFWKVSDGTEGSTQTWTMTDADPHIGICFNVHNDLGAAFDIASTVLTDTTETGTAVSATGTTIGVTVGDLVCVLVSIKSDVDNHSSQTYTQTGCTFSTVSWTANLTTSGSDMNSYWSVFSCTAGTNSAAPTYAATASVSGSSACSVSVVRVRSSTGGSLTLLDAPMRSYYW